VPSRLGRVGWELDRICIGDVKVREDSWNILFAMYGL
jgi:hypothetical protein